MNVPCTHPHAVEKRYVGSTETYMYCPSCFGTWGGEETLAKERLLRAAAEADGRDLSGDDERHADG